LAIRIFLYALERGGFVSFVGARHVRATKHRIFDVIFGAVELGRRALGAGAVRGRGRDGRLRADSSAKSLRQPRGQRRVESKKVGGFTNCATLADELRTRCPA